MQINLLPQPESSRPYWTLVLTSITGVLVLANLWAGMAWMAASEERRMADEMYERISGRLPQLQQQAVELRKREGLARQIKAFHQWAASRPKFQDEVQLLSSLLPRNSALLTVHFVGDSNYDVKASLPDLESVATYLRQLQKNPRVVSVKVNNITRQTLTLSTGGFPTSVPAVMSPSTVKQSSVDDTRVNSSSESSGGTGTSLPNPNSAPVQPRAESLNHGDGNTGHAGPTGTSKGLSSLEGGQVTSDVTGSATQAGRSSSPSTKSVYELDFSVTLGR